MNIRELFAYLITVTYGLGQAESLNPTSGP
jgi:hypothetical protein